MFGITSFNALLVDPRVRLAMRIFEFEQTQPPSVEDVAARVGMSPFHLAHLFAEQVGEACASYSRRIRLENSTNQLMHDPVPLSVVAGWFGYGSQAAYTRAFTRHFGMPPQRYAEAVLGRSQDDYARTQLDREGQERGAVQLSEEQVVLTRWPSRPALARRFYGHDIAGHWRRFLTDLPKALAAGAQLVGMAYDSPRATPEHRWRYDCAVFFEHDAQTRAGLRDGLGLDLVELPGGLHAEVNLEGDFIDTWRAIIGLFTQWLPRHPEYRTEGDPVVHLLHGSPLEGMFSATATIRVYPHQKLPTLNLKPLTRHGRPAGYRTPPAIC